jgi:chemotaxis protein CheD
MPSPSLAALAGFDQKIVVGVGDLAVTNNQAVVLATYSLGSCLAVTIYDPVMRVGGLLHLMLPDSSINAVKAARQPAMFADTGLPALFQAAYQMKANKHRVRICLAGGAQFMGSNGVFSIGQRNYGAVVGLLGRQGLKVHATEVGGLVSRSVALDVGTGEVRLRISGRMENMTLCEGH